MFDVFAKLVHDRLVSMLKDGNVFESNAGADLLWLKYLDSFPAGTNLIHVKNRYHDCNCCRHFIKGIGSLIRIDEVSVIDTIWDTAAEAAPEPYRTVARKLRDAVKQGGVRGIFRRTAKNPSYGTQHNVAKDPYGMPKRDVLGNIIVWDHFWTGKLPSHIIVNDGAEVSEHQARMATFKRSCLEISKDAINTVMSLIDSNSIYRGAEFSGLVESFSNNQDAYLDEPSENLLALVAHHSPAVASFRNTVIGSLAIDIDSGMDVEQAVRSYESKVALLFYSYCGRRLI